MTNATTTTKNGLFDVAKMMGDFRIPGIDLEAAIANQRKNVAALTQANQLAVAGVQALMRRQVEITRQAMEEFSAAFGGFGLLQLVLSHGPDCQGHDVIVPRHV